MYTLLEVGIELIFALDLLLEEVLRCFSPIMAEHWRCLFKKKKRKTRTTKLFVFSKPNQTMDPNVARTHVLVLNSKFDLQDGLAPSITVYNKN